MNFLLASASRPITSCWAARALHARHQSFHDATPAVTSSKSVSATPFATKRGAQWAIADLTSASMIFPFPQPEAPKVGLEGWPHTQFRRPRPSISGLGRASVLLWQESSGLDH